MQSVEDIIARGADGGREALIPLLQAIQAEVGYLPPAAMERVAAALEVPVSRAYGVATFYNQFRFVPFGAHVIQVCRGTACHVKGSQSLAEHLRRRLELRPDGNSPDDRFTVLTVACLGACSIAPAIKLDGEFYGHLTAESLDRLLDETVAADAAPATTGEPTAPVEGGVAP